MQLSLKVQSYFSDLSPTRRSILSFSLFSAVLLAHRYLSGRQRRQRQRKIPPNEERVLILGASSGVGRELALQYAGRGAYVCLVARNEGVEDVKQECINAISARDYRKDGEKKFLSVIADFSNPEDMVRVRERVQTEWGRLDTLAVVAGVSALKPLLATAGVQPDNSSRDRSSLPDANLQGIQDGLRTARAAIQGNFYGPLTAALTFIPLLSRTSPSPSVLLMSSLAAVAPAPTRALYCSTKSASLLLYQSLAIEHPSIHFTSVMPYTIEGNFRASAVDAGTVRESDPSKSGLKREDVARRCILAIDGQERDVFMYGWYRILPFLYYIVSPRIVDRATSKKYRYP